MTEPLYEARTFEEFWQHYRAAHATSSVRRLHAVATASAIALAVTAWHRRSLALAIAAPIVDYAIAQASHRWIDGRKTHPHRRPLWHARAELRLFRDTLRFR
jgi:hypothetical protein